MAGIGRAVTIGIKVKFRVCHQLIPAQVDAIRSGRAVGSRDSRRAADVATRIRSIRAGFVTRPREVVADIVKLL